MELKTTDLRIGNYINIDLPISEEGKLIRIGSVNSKKINGVDFKKYEPIPLTQEWLIKFGFHYSDDDNEFLELELMHKIKLYADNSNNFSTVVLRLKENEIEIKSVHQLQNLYFVLKGKELTHQKIN